MMRGHDDGAEATEVHGSFQGTSCARDVAWRPDSVKNGGATWVLADANQCQEEADEGAPVGRVRRQGGVHDGLRD